MSPSKLFGMNNSLRSLLVFQQLLEKNRKSYLQAQHGKEWEFRFF